MHFTSSVGDRGDKSAPFSPSHAVLHVIERFCLPPDAKVIYKDATGTEVDAEIFSDLVGQGNVVLTGIIKHFTPYIMHRPTKAIREDYARGIVMFFPSLKDPYSKKGYEHLYDAASSTGYISWRLKTVQMKI
ncbi:unnamed protein product, partial [Coregonus sp. 'balchen']